jgi:hypothetical protein
MSRDAVVASEISEVAEEYGLVLGMARERARFELVEMLPATWEGARERFC